MVQLNPLKWGQKGRQKRKKIEGLKIKATTKTGTGRSAAKRQVGARKELEKMGETWKSEKKKSKLPPKVGTGRSASQRQRGVGSAGKSTTSKSTTSKSKGKGGGVTINGKPPTMTQKKLLAGGWTAKELEAKINARKKK